MTPPNGEYNRLVIVDTTAAPALYFVGHIVASVFV